MLRLRSNGKFKVLVDEGFTGAGPLAVTDNGDLWVGQGFFPGTVEPSGADSVWATMLANGEIAPARRVAAFPTYQSLQDPGRPAGFNLFATGMA